MGNEVIVNFKGFQVKIPFETLEDLKAKMSVLDVKELEEIVTTALGEVTIGAATKPGFEGIYTVGSDGLPQLLRVPNSEAKTAALALFAAEPRRLTPDELAKVSGIKEVGRKYLSSGSYKRLFSKDVEGKYGLSHEGRKLVINNIIPALNSQQGEKK